MTSLRLVLVVAIVVTALGFADASQKAAETLPTVGPTGPLDVVESSVSRVLGLVQSQLPGVKRNEDRRAEIRRAVHDLFDFNGMARRTLGQQWKSLSPQEQAEFVERERGVRRAGTGRGLRASAFQDRPESG